MRLRLSPLPSLPLKAGGGRSVPCLPPPPLRAGLSHLGEEGEQEGIVPSGAFDFSAERSLVRMRSENVEGQLSQNREVLRSMVLAVSGAILVEDNVENPMELVLDRS